MKNSKLPIQFKEDIRVLMLIDRGVQNSNKGSKRWINKIITTDPIEFDNAVSKLIELQNHLNDKDVRLYSCVNSRKMDKAIITFKHKQLDLNKDNEYSFYRRINDSFCSCLMQPENRERSLFLLDVDTKDLTEVNGFLIKNNDIAVYYSYPTPSGWHFITHAFNPLLCEEYSTFEIKKDALILLNWIE